MNKQKKLIIEIIIFIAVLISITLLYNFLINRNSLKEDSPNEIEQQLQQNVLAITNTEQFEQENINKEETALIYFHARWCMPCRAMNSIIEEIANEYSNVKVVKIDIDKNNELAIKYDIVATPTILIMKNGNITKSFVGAVDKNVILEEI